MYLLKRAMKTPRSSAETPVTVALDGIDAQTERGVIYRLYLLDVETMELMPVESPDGILGVNLAAGSVFGMEYRPRMVWNPDGTIVLLKSNGKIGFYRLNVN